MWPLNKMNICRFSSARLKLMMSHECADGQNGIGLCTRGPERPDICFGKCWGWSIGLDSACVCVGAYKQRHLRVKEAEMDLCYFFCRSFIHPCLWRRIKEECFSAGKTTTVFLPFQSLPLLIDNGITHQRSFSVYPSSVTSTSLCSYSPQQLLSPKLPPAGFSLLPLSLWERLNFDEIKY